MSPPLQLNTDTAEQLRRLEGSLSALSISLATVCAEINEAREAIERSEEVARDIAVAMAANVAILAVVRENLD